MDCIKWDVDEGTWDMLDAHDEEASIMDYFEVNSNNVEEGQQYRLEVIDN